MATTELTVQVSFDLLEKSPELQDLLRQLIREELMHLDPDVAIRIGRSIRAQAGLREYEVKTSEQ